MSKNDENSQRPFLSHPSFFEEHCWILPAFSPLWMGVRINKKPSTLNIDIHATFVNQCGTTRHDAAL